MNSDRKPVRDAYDAIVDLWPLPTPTHAYALLKLTFAIENGKCRLDAAEPLKHDIRDPAVTPPIPVGTDFWRNKDATDVIIHGSAFPKGGKPAARRTVLAQVGPAIKRVQVIGPRQLEWRSGKPKIGAPEPFSEVSLTYDNAYGGVDPRVPVPNADSFEMQMLLQVDHPGLYPRNPFGKGYLVIPEPLDGFDLPNLEDPDDLLTDERLVVGDPKRWYEQPLPWCLHWMHLMMFPRYLFSGLGVDAWFPAPEDERLPEVRRGYLIEGCRTALARRENPSTPHSRFYQEGSYGFVFERLDREAPVVLEGMHPEQDILRFRLPGMQPVIEFDIEGRKEQPEPKLHHVVIRPGDQRLTMVYGASVELPRTFIPGVHKYIPISISVNRDQPIAYEAPTPVLERLQAAGAKIGS